MRISSLLAAATLIAGVVLHGAPAQAAVPPLCGSTLGGVATKPSSGLVSVAIVATAFAEVDCSLDPLDTTPATYLTGWHGDLHLEIQTADGEFLPGCNTGISPVPAVGPTVVMAMVVTCTIPTTSPDYFDDLYATIVYGTAGPTWDNTAGQNRNEGMTRV